MKKKEFIIVFIGCLILGYIALTIFLTIDSFWMVFIAIIFFVAMLITMIMKQTIKIEEIEKKLDDLLNNNDGSVD